MIAATRAPDNDCLWNMDHPLSLSRVMTSRVWDVESRTIPTVVLAQARTHYPRYELLHDAGASIPTTTKTR
ncbi:hypothetical protein, partial [Bradyrhizobium tropiciagri]|uniref:hypothetical protein n=1 Tax=Bradyrhizobium tropiciagri TaxID=312253 RepID=UPI000AB45C65